MDKRIATRIDGELLYLDGAWLHSSTTMNKTIYQSWVLATQIHNTSIVTYWILTWSFYHYYSLQNETHVYTEENARFIPGHGMAFRL